MAELSPAAQAILKAAEDSYWCFDAMAPANAEVIAAGVLRAVIEQVQTDPEQRRHYLATFAELAILDKIREIATELEGING